MPDSPLYTRSDCIRYVEKKSEKILFHYGEGFMSESLPVGTRVIYPPPPLRAIQDVDQAIEHALEHPLGCDPLSAQLRTGMKVTIAFDDISLPLPPMTTPDIRQRVITSVLKKLAAAGVTDIHLIAATSLHRRMTPEELRRVLGSTIYDAFAPDRLYNHDAEDKDGNVFLGKTEKGEEIEINRRAVESDLLIYVNINLVSMDGGNKSVPVGLGTYRSLRYHHTVDTLMHSLSYFDPPHSAMHHSCNRMGKVVAEHMNIFTIETTLNNDGVPHWLTFLRKPHHRFNLLDTLNLHVNKLSTDLLPASLKRDIFFKMYAPYGLTGIHAGRTNFVHEKTLNNIYRQQVVLVNGQADIVVIGVPYICPYNVNSIMNPILVMCLALGYFFNFYRGKPLIRRDGVYILLYPLHEDFHPVNHPSYIEFYNRVLTDTRDPKTVEQKYEQEFAYNPKYIDLYRHSYAYHGVHPFYMWYWGCYALSYLGKVIVVKPRTKRPADIMGFETADSLPEALERAQSYVGPNPKITNYQIPPLLLCDVE
ncbi:MAG: DUF2088 domain-containing protein [Candidatus Latescibacteria bacterium]|nr:DUF2088 domain-containing protein [Candidatus Latescibacterota bacterium]